MGGWRRGKAKEEDISKIIKIALIGAGQLGSRHLQALTKIDIPVILQVVDPDTDSLKVAQERYLEIPANHNIQTIVFLTEIDGLSANLDLCIIATNADVRFKVFQELVSKKKVAYIIFEKIVFQSEKQFEGAKKLINQNDISCWVNFPRRIYPIYQELKKNFDEKENIEFHLSGGDWGLACNGIHFIDLLAFFADDTRYQLDVSGLEPKIWPSKRTGFIELTGRLAGTFSGGSQIILESLSNSRMPTSLSINSSHVKIDIDETQGLGRIARIDNKWKEKSFDFEIPFQSELTHLVAKEILESGTCKLTNFDESYVLHVPYLDAIKKHVESIEERKYDCCPIT